MFNFFRFKKGEDDGYSFSDKVPSVWGSNPWVFSEIKSELQQSPGILNRNSVAFLLRKVIKGKLYQNIYILVFRLEVFALQRLCAHSAKLFGHLHERLLLC